MRHEYLVSLKFAPDNEGEKTKANVFCLPQYDN